MAVGRKIAPGAQMPKMSLPSVDGGQVQLGGEGAFRSGRLSRPALSALAAHGWNIHRAGRAGLITGFVARQNEPFPQ